MDREITKIVIILLKFISEAAVLFVIRAFYIVHAYIYYIRCTQQYHLVQNWFVLALNIQRL